MASRTSIVVVSRNSVVPLRAMLTKLNLKEAISNEVMVVDDASEDGTAEMVAGEFSTVRLIRRETSKGWARAANMGIREASGETIVFCHADVIAEIHELQELADRLQGASRAAMVLARVRGIDGTEQPTVGLQPTLPAMLSGVVNPQSARGCEIASLDHVADHEWAPIICAAVDVAAIAKVGSFDDAFRLGFADTDFCKRLHEKGLRILIHPDVSVTHAGAAPGGSLGDDDKRLMREDLLRYVDKHGTGVQKLLVRQADALRKKVQKED